MIELDIHEKSDINQITQEFSNVIEIVMNHFSI